MHFNFIFHWYLAFFCLQNVDGKRRVHYVAVIDTIWDYAPAALNIRNGIALDADSHAATFTKKSPNRIGKIYDKAVYREYTDRSFTKQKPRDESFGLLGPVLKGEQGDVLIIVFKNLASRNYTMHPHTVFYSKASEGALYADSTSGAGKADDYVAPGKTQTYIWVVSQEGTPAAGDPNCLTWLYHSHIKPTMDMNTGPVGMIETCKKGFLNEDGSRNDVTKEFYLLFHVIDENKSWYLDESLKRSGIDPSKVNKEDEDFKESNLMHSINGRVYGNLNGFDVCQGDKVVWHLSVLGSEVDMHSISFHGNLIVSDHHRTDTRVLFPAHSGTVTMQADNPGKWMFECKIADHWNAGMFGFYNVSAACGQENKAVTFNGKVREYFIAAEEISWRYSPSQYNSFDGEPLDKTGSDSSTFFVRGPNRIGGTYIKANYREFMDATFTKRKPRSLKDERHLGFLGPVIKGEVGDKILVHFKNKLSINASIHARGVLYNKSNEGSLYDDNTKLKADDVVLPGTTYTYEWTIPESMAPTAKDTPCISWLYSSSVDPVKDTYSGLVGPLVTCNAGSLQTNGIPKGFDAEKYLFPAVMDENESWYLEKNMERYCTSPKCGGISKDDKDFKESNKMHQINGFMFGDIGIEMCSGKKVIFYAFAIGTEIDLHSIYFSGNGIDVEGNHKDSLMIFPGSSTTFTMTPDNTGTWALGCRVNDHYQTGMKFLYTVKSCVATQKLLAPVTKRKYYIGIVEKDWDYAPNNLQLTSGGQLNTDSNAKTFTERTSTTIGKVYKKAIYVAYTDETFTKVVQDTDRTEHLGILGPMILAEERDEIVVVAKNMATRNYSVNPHGVFYSKDNEGTIYNDGTSHRGGSIAPGKTYTYHWFVNSRSTPGPNDGACLTWAYYSAVDPVKDTNTGLVGPLITCRKGTLVNGKRIDVDREFAILFSVLDENESWYLDDNIKKFTLKPNDVVKTNENFKESNKMHAINGYIYSNGPQSGGQFKMNMGDKVAWYVIGLGNEIDIHTVHFHGNSFIHRTNSEHVDDVYDIFPGVFASLEMTPVNPGKWLLHCHVNDHKQGGMETIFEVKKKIRWGESKGSSLKSSCLAFLLLVAVLVNLW
ncbi:hephaestin-like protein isoform X2 [Rhopilema esculentum]|uniref:hephaestin-like protein isoform X2 n=1 Tax=Rhopilema esculentum TaxID=499914 RepID=UPI0031D1E8E3